MKLSALRQAFILVSMASAGGCISVDLPADSERPVANGLNLVNGEFLNEPTYRSHRLGNTGPPDLASVFGEPPLPHAHIDSVSMSFSEANGLVVRFISRSKVVGGRTITKKDGLSETPSALSIRDAGCAGPGLGLGCSADSYLIYVDKHDELVVVSTTVGAGIVILVPMAGYKKLMSTFQRLVR